MTELGNFSRLTFAEYLLPLSFLVRAVSCRLVFLHKVHHPIKDKSS